MAIGDRYLNEEQSGKKLRLVTLPPFCSEFAAKVGAIATNLMSDLHGQFPTNGDKQAKEIYNDHITNCGDLIRDIHALNDIYRQLVANAILEQYGIALPTHPRGRFLEERHVKVSNDTLDIVYGELQYKLDAVLRENGKDAHKISKDLFPKDLIEQTEAAIKEHAALIKKQAKKSQSPSFEERERAKSLKGGLNTPPVI